MNPRIRSATTVVLVWASITVLWLVSAVLFWTATASLGDGEHQGIWGDGSIRILLIELAITVVTGAVLVTLAVAARRTSHGATCLGLGVMMIGLTLAHLMTLLLTGGMLFLSSIVGLFVVFTDSGDRYFSLFGYGMLSIALDGALIVLGVMSAVQLLRIRPVPLESPA